MLSLIYILVCIPVLIFIMFSFIMCLRAHTILHTYDICIQTYLLYVCMLYTCMQLYIIYTMHFGGTRLLMEAYVVMYYLINI